MDIGVMHPSNLTNNLNNSERKLATLSHMHCIVYVAAKPTNLLIG